MVTLPADATGSGSSAATGSSSPGPAQHPVGHDRRPRHASPVGDACTDRGRPADAQPSRGLALVDQQADESAADAGPHAEDDASAQRNAEPASRLPTPQRELGDDRGGNSRSRANRRRAGRLVAGRQHARLQRHARRPQHWPRRLHLAARRVKGHAAHQRPRLLLRLVGRDTDRGQSRHAVAEGQGPCHRHVRAGSRQRRDPQVPVNRMWLPAVDAKDRWAVSWMGSLTVAGSSVTPTTGGLYLVDWRSVDPFVDHKAMVAPTATPGPDAAGPGHPAGHTAGPPARRASGQPRHADRPVTSPSPVAPAPSIDATGTPSIGITPQAVEPARDETTDPVLDWQVRWADSGSTFGYWIADGQGANWGRLAVLRLLPAAGGIDYGTPLLDLTLAKRSFSLGVRPGRLGGCLGRPARRRAATAHLGRARLRRPAHPRRQRRRRRARVLRARPAAILTRTFHGPARRARRGGGARELSADHDRRRRAPRARPHRP